MKVYITSKMLSIPPYISTSWSNIASLHTKEAQGGDTLIVTLHNGASIEVPHMDTRSLQIAFSAHAQFIEKEQKTPRLPQSILPPINLPMVQQQLISLEIPLKEGLESIPGINTFIEHNPEQANAPDLPPEVLEKITQISQSMGITDPQAFPKPEPHCNCMRCQIARAMQSSIHDTHVDEEEIVSDEELTFKTWDITKNSDMLYTVTNPLDPQEHYQVFLGNPVGCTCGEKHCEHILTVLKT